MNQYLDIIKFIIPVLIAILGWIVGHRFNSKRDLKNKQREIVILHNIDVFTKLSETINRTDNKSMKDFEDAISSIQLLGTSRQAALARKAADEVANHGKTELDELLMDLRQTIRSELSLEQINEKYQWLRFSNHK